jgi:hypothetical protein
MLNHLSLSLNLFLGKPVFEVYPIEVILVPLL